ncbi:MAG: protein-L-isoaspartate(D-aspartate) O-methyltransferase [Nitrososphaeria archaeon]|jgi:protein-L-isoaspartate(D-aspartate) O-methyltransferase
MTYERARRELVEDLIRRGVIKSATVAEAMLKVPRELFVWPGTEERAYDDIPLPLGNTGQTISAPHMVAVMLEELDVMRGHAVLEVGAGSGYNAALLAELVGPDGRVVSVERMPELVDFARSNLTRAGYSDRVDVVLGDGSLGYPPGYAGPLYDRITITAAAPHVPKYALSQLKDGGVLLVPIGPQGYQVLTRVRKAGGSFTSEELLGCVFVPLVGEDGYRADRRHQVQGTRERDGHAQEHAGGDDGGGPDAQGRLHNRRRRG